MTADDLIALIRREAAGQLGPHSSAGLIAYLHERLAHAERQVQHLQESNTAYATDNRLLRERCAALLEAADALRQDVVGLRDRMLGDATLGALVKDGRAPLALYPNPHNEHVAPNGKPIDGYPRQQA